MNFIFISPNFPSYFDRFCAGLNAKGVTVLGIGDCPYDSLTEKLHHSLGEYYYIESLENYDDILKACHYFSERYGKIDFIQSLNEHWLISEAKARTDCNVQGIKYPDIMDYKRKYSMKYYYEKAGIPTARCIKPTKISNAYDFVKTVNYPIIAKPNSGVGASKTYKIKNDKELENLFSENYEDYILEEFIKGDVITFDGIVNHHGNLVFGSSHIMLGQLIDTVNKDIDIAYYGEMNIDPRLITMTKKIIAAYNLQDCFFHFEFFKLTEAKKGLGDIGDIIGLELNMRPPGGLITEVINYTYDIDIYDVWANVIANNTVDREISAKRFVGYASRKYNIKYKHHNDEIYANYGDNIIVKHDIEPVFRQAMGDYTYIIKADGSDKIKEIVKFIQSVEE